MKLFIYTAAFVMLLTSCTKSQKLTFKIASVIFEKEGPFFADQTESVQFTLTTELENYLKEQKIALENIDHIYLKEATFTNLDSTKFNFFNSITLNLAAGGDGKLLTMGSINPIDVNAANAKISGSQEADLKVNFLNAEKFLVCDLNMIKDKEQNLKLSADFEFEIVTK